MTPRDAQPARFATVPNACQCFEANTAALAIGSAMKPEDLHAFSVPTFSSRAAPFASTPLDRGALARIRHMVAAARVRFLLWDGFEAPSTAGAPVGTIVFKNRRTLLSWLWDADLNFGETYMLGAVDLLGDQVATLNEIFRALGPAKLRLWWLRQRSNDVCAAKGNLHRDDDLRNEFYELSLDREPDYTACNFRSRRPRSMRRRSRR